MKAKEKRGTNSTALHASVTFERISGKTEYDEWLDSDNWSWFEKTEKDWWQNIIEYGQT